jgi:hypothetical protein
VVHTFFDPARVAVTVRGEAAGLSVDVRPAGDDPHMGAGPGIQPNGDGVAMLGPLAPGTYDIGIVVPLGRTGSVFVIGATRELGAGEHAITLAAPARFRLTVDAGDEAAAKRILLQRANGRYLHGYDGAVEGNARVFESLPPARYELALGGETMEVDLRADTRVPFRGQAYDALRVREAFAGLQAGDLIVTVDGQAIKDRSHAYALIRVAAEKGRATLTIVRAGKTLAVEAALSEDAWKQLEPVSR